MFRLQLSNADRSSRGPRDCIPLLDFKVHVEKYTFRNKPEKSVKEIYFRKRKSNLQKRTSKSAFQNAHLKKHKKAHFKNVLNTYARFKKRLRYEK
jgi:hypothetical protein